MGGYNPLLHIYTLEMTKSADKMFDALADSRRRRLLFALFEKNPETDPPRGQDSLPDIRRIEYQHNHLPKLDEYGFIEWTRNANTVERGPHFEEIEPLLELLDADQQGLQPAEQF